MIIQQTSRTDAVEIARAELAALSSTVQGLGPGDFARSTDCEGWTVRDIVAHLTGALDEAVHPHVQARHMVMAKTRLRRVPVADALTHQQVADRAERSDSELARELAELAPRVPRARARVPQLLRKLPFPDPGALPGDNLGYLLDVIYSRDVWMHRIDISRAIARPMPHSDAEDAIVEQVVRDLQRGWSGPSFTLVLTGRVEGSWLVGNEGDEDQTVTEDCVALCRLLSGRSDETSLAADAAAGSAQAQLRHHRIVF